jgi:hypothetical protein
MSIRELKKRVRCLEQLSQIDANLVLMFADGRQTRMLGSARHFFCLVDHLRDPETFRATRPAGSLTMAEHDLDSLRRAVRIEGESSQLFGLLQALVLGPAGGKL